VVAFILAVTETVLLFAAVSGTVMLWTRPVLIDWMDVVALLSQGFAVSLCCVVSFYYNDLYDLHIVRSFSGFSARLLQSFGVAFILLAIFYAAFPATEIGRGPFVSSLVIVAGLLLPLRAASYVVMRRRPERVLILGTSSLARKLVSEIEARPHLRYAIAGIVEDTVGSDWQEGLAYPRLGPVAHLQKIVGDLRPGRIIVAMTERRGRLPVDQLLAVRVQGVIVEDGVEVYERLTGKVAVEVLSPSSLIFSKDFRKSPFDLAVARAISLAVSLVGFVGLAPLLAVIAIAIKLDSRGPVFFVQRRVGRNGNDFNLLKFRTMMPVPAELSQWARDNSDRITRVGKWLRKFRLDELPQFLNILRGDMNLVGPRPHPVSNYQLFIRDIPYYALRSVVRPGVTGWAQVRYGYANDLQEETEKMRYDLYYVKHLSLWSDLRILFDTIKIVLFGRGATEADAYPAEVRVAAKR
jgi:exopolysaccharide biosynthesis polyprenyl glycosylphosphotransferase